MKVKVFIRIVYYEKHAEIIQKEFGDWLDSVNIKIIQMKQSFHDNLLIITVVYDELI